MPLKLYAFLIHFLFLLASSGLLFLSLSLRKAVEEAMDPGLAGITAYVSQDCTGMKDDPAVDKNRILGTAPEPTLLFSTISLRLRDWSCLKW